MQAEISYNWDDIKVGRFDLNHSENFFSQKHCKHEKFSEEFHLIQTMATRNLNESFSNDIAIQCQENKENTTPTNNQPEKQTIETISTASKAEVKLEIHVPKKQTPKSLTISNGNNSHRPANQLLHTKTPQLIVSQSKNQLIEPAVLTPKVEPKVESSETETNTTASVTTATTVRRPANLLTRPKTPQPQIKSKNGGTGSAIVGKNGKPSKGGEPPHAYDFQKIYQKKKEEMMRNLLEEEKKNRIFHSRPMPKPIAAPNSLLVRKDCEGGPITAAKTPNVLKNSREADERRKQRVAEWKKNNAPIKFTSRQAAVLHEEPFRPKKSGQTVQMQPFNLHVERRIEERRQYDEQLKRTAEEKKKQEEEERKKREEELVKELRKLASFKARPNPFKH